MEYSAKELIDLLFVTDEQERIEAKKSSSIGNSIMETVCAYANEPGLGGGYLLLGVEPALETESGYNICGLPDSDRILNDHQSCCRTQFNISLNNIRSNIEIINRKRVAPFVKTGIFQK